MEEVVAFVLELDMSKEVLRKVKLIGLTRYENSAEPSWQTAMLAFSLAPSAAPDVDLNRVLQMLLGHDIGGQGGAGPAQLVQRRRQLGGKLR